MVMDTILAEQLFMARNLEWEGVVPKAGFEPAHPCGR
jgi:hypothetical protein